MKSNPKNLLLSSTARLSFPLATALAALITAQSAQAVDSYWDPALTTTITGTGAGGGIWLSTTANWVTTAGTNVVLPTANRASFGGAAGGVVNVEGPNSAAGMIFNTTGYTLSAASAQTITINSAPGNVSLASSSVTATIGSNVTVSRGANDAITTVTGTGGVLNIGAADQSSTGARYINTQSGSTGTRTLSITSGTIVNVNSGGYLGQSPDTVYVTTSNPNGTSILIGSATGGSLVVKTGGTVTNGNNQAFIVGGATASGTLTIDGGQVNAGTVTIGTSGSLPTGTAIAGLRFGSLSNNDTGTRIANLNGGVLTVGQVFTGASVATPSFTNTFNFNGGTLQASLANAAFMTGLTTANVQVGGAKIDSNSFDITVGQALIHDSALGATLDGGLTKSSAGTLTLTAANTYTGNTTISGGTLKLSSPGKLGYTSGTSGTYAGAMSIDCGAIFENASSGTQNLNGAITGGGTLTNSGGGGLALTNAGNSFGALSISSAGSRVFINTNAAALPAAATVNIASGALVFAVPATRANAITIASGAALSARNATTLSNVTLPDTGSVVFNNDDANTQLLTINNGQTLTGALTVQIGGSRMAAITTALGGVTLAGNLTGIGGLVVASSGNLTNNPTLFGTGVLTLSGACDYTGATTVTAGTLAVTGSLGATAVTVSSPAILGGNGNIGGSVTIDSGATHALAVAATPGTQVTRAITGTLTLTAGNLLELTAAATPAGGEYVLATAPTISGTIDNANIDYNGITGMVSIDTASSPDRLLLTVTAANNYASWAASQVPPVVEGSNGDDDKDGVKNLIEYALADGQERGTLTGTSLSFAKRGGVYGGDITYEIESSDNLGISDPWSTVTPTLDNASTISYTLPNPGDNFARLKVVQVP
jgi:autotransporter-associated beta strand protein